MNVDIVEIIKELEFKKRNYEECFSSKETKIIKEWNRAIDACINVLKKYV